MLNKVIDIQRAERLTDLQMADQLGIARPTWNRIRNGHAPFSAKLAVRAAGVWPELTRDLLDQASASVSVVPETSTATAHLRGSVLQSRTAGQ